MLLPEAALWILTALVSSFPRPSSGIDGIVRGDLLCVLFVCSCVLRDRSGGLRFVNPMVKKHFDYIENHLKSQTGGYFVGSELTGADFLMSFVRQSLFKHRVYILTLRVFSPSSAAPTAMSIRQPRHGTRRSRLVQLTLPPKPKAASALSCSPLRPDYAYSCPCRIDMKQLAN